MKKIQGVRTPNPPPHPIAMLGLLLFGLAAARCGSSSGQPTPDTSPGPNQNANQVATHGNSTDGNTPSSTHAVTLQLNITSFSFDASAGSLDANLLRLSFNDPNQAFNGAGAPYDANSLSDTGCSVSNSVLTCTVTLSEFDVSAYTQGLLVLTGDTRPSASSPLWRQVYTLVPQADIDAAKAATNRTLTVKAGAVTDVGETAIATWSGLGNTSAYLGLGATMGVVLQSDGSTPVSGATLHTGANVYNVYYANDAANGTKSGSTGAEGLFLAVNANGKAAANTDWTLTPTSGSMTWSVSYSGTVPYALTVIFLNAN